MKAQFHLSDECFVPFMVSLAYNKRAPFIYEMNEALLKAGQAGYIAKFERDLEWEYYRLASSRLLMVRSSSFACITFISTTRFLVDV